MKLASKLAWLQVFGALAASGTAGEIPRAVVLLDVPFTQRAGEAPEAAPARFVLLEGGQVFVGGARALLAGSLASRELKDLERRIEQVRKLRGLVSPVTLGPGEHSYRLRVPGKRALELVATGDPARAPAALLPLARLLADLESFDHPSLRPYAPESYLLSVRDGSLAGGCRAWTFPTPLAEALAAPRVVSAGLARGWPTGAAAASVCAGEKRYLVTLRPLLPSERP